MIDALAWALALLAPLTLLSTIYLHVVAIRARPRSGLLDDWARIAVLLSILATVSGTLSLAYLAHLPELGVPGGVAFAAGILAAVVVPDYLALRVALIRRGRGLSIVPPHPDAQEETPPDDVTEESADG